MTTEFIKKYCLEHICIECSDNKICDKKCIGECLPTQELDFFSDWLKKNDMKIIKTHETIDKL